jgi:hypothetical protein
MAFGVLFVDFALRRIPHEWNLITVPGFFRISCVLVLLICQFVANGDDSMKGRQAAVAEMQQSHSGGRISGICKEVDDQTFCKRPCRM